MSEEKIKGRVGNREKGGWGTGEGKGGEQGKGRVGNRERGGWGTGEGKGG